MFTAKAETELGAEWFFSHTVTLKRIYTVGAKTHSKFKSGIFNHFYKILETMAISIGLIIQGFWDDAFLYAYFHFLLYCI